MHCSDEGVPLIKPAGSASRVWRFMTLMEERLPEDTSAVWKNVRVRVHRFSRRQHIPQRCSHPQYLAAHPQCLLCSTCFRMTQSKTTSPMINHLKLKHPDEFKSGTRTKQTQTKHSQAKDSSRHSNHMCVQTSKAAPLLGLELSEASTRLVDGEMRRQQPRPRCPWWARQGLLPLVQAGCGRCLQPSLP